MTIIRLKNVNFNRTSERKLEFTPFETAYNKTTKLHAKYQKMNLILQTVVDVSCFKHPLYYHFDAKLLLRLVS